MTPLEFLKLVWPDKGLYCLAMPKVPRGMRHEVFDSIEAAVNRAIVLAEKENVFFATHSLLGEQIWNQQHHKDRETREWVAGWSVRTQTNMRESKILFFDLDVASENDDEKTRAKKYPDKLSAVRSISEFARAVGLTLPMVVDSGGGIHIYWLLDRTLASNTDWVALAAKLKQLAIAHGIKFDPTRTTDTSSVLRVVGTYNHKKETLRPVRLLAETKPITVEDFHNILDDGLKVLDLQPVQNRAVIKELGSNTGEAHTGPPPTMVSLLKACPQIRRIAKVYGAESDEPEWHSSIGVVKFVENGKYYCHKISSGHRTYTYVETEEKIDRWDTGPTTCRKMREDCGPANYSLCDACPWFKKKDGESSPIARASQIDADPTPTVKLVSLDEGVIDEIRLFDPPNGYKFDRDGGVVHFMKKKDSEELFPVPIYPYKLYPVVRSNTERKETQVWRVHSPHDPTKEFKIPADTFADDRSLVKLLANNGVYPEKYGEVRNYMSSYIRELQRRSAAMVEYDHLGWINDRTEFILPGRILMPEKKQRIGVLNEECTALGNIIKTKGTLQDQVNLLHFWDHPFYIKHRMFMSMSLGSVLMHISEHEGLLVNATGDTSRGKSFALETAASFWGHPKHYYLDAQRGGGTFLGRNKRRSLLGSLPTMIDEMTGIDHDSLETLVLGITQPGLRVTSFTITPAEIERSQIILSTTNNSLYDVLSTNNRAGIAGLVRVFELGFPVIARGPHTVGEAEDMRRQLYQNFGHIGPYFVRAVVNNKAMVVDKYLKVLDRLRTQALVRAPERFWFSGMASAIVAIAICRDLKLVSWDPYEMWRYFVQIELPSHRGIVVAEEDAMSPLVTLADFLQEYSGNVLVTTTMGAENVPNNQVYGPLFGHLNRSTGKLLVLKAAFKGYCRKKGRDAERILKELHAAGIVTQIEIKRTIGWGTINYEKTRSSCFEVNFRHPETRAMLDSKEQQALSAPGGEDEQASDK